MHNSSDTSLSSHIGSFSASVSSSSFNYESPSSDSAAGTTWSAAVWDSGGKPCTCSKSNFLSFVVWEGFIPYLQSIECAITWNLVYRAWLSHTPSQYTRGSSWINYLESWFNAKDYDYTLSCLPLYTGRHDHCLSASSTGAATSAEGRPFKGFVQAVFGVHEPVLSSPSSSTSSNLLLGECSSFIHRGGRTWYTLWPRDSEWCVGTTQIRWYQWHECQWGLLSTQWISSSVQKVRVFSLRIVTSPWKY